MNTIVSRRRLLAATSLVPIAFALDACNGTAGLLAPIAVSAFQAVGKEAVLIAPQLVQYGLSQADADNIVAGAKIVAAVAGAITGTSTALQGADTLSKIEAYVNAVAPIVAPFAPLIPGGTVIGLVIVALPEIEMAINFGASLLSQMAKQVAATAPPLPAAAARVGAASVNMTRIDQLIAASQGR